MMGDWLIVWTGEGEGEGEGERVEESGGNKLVGSKKGAE